MRASNKKAFYRRSGFDLLPANYSEPLGKRRRIERVSLLKYLHVLHLVERASPTPSFGLARRRARARKGRGMDDGN